MTDTSLIDVVTPADPWAGRPSLSRGVVPRPRLVAALAATGPGCVAVLAAPAGYGKTTLLCQWEAADARPFAWLGLDSRDDEDPARLAERLAALLGGLPADEPFVLVLDDAHALGSTPARLALRRIVAELPAGAVVALATRGEAPLPLARLRAQQRLVELGAGRLAMTREETAGVLGLGDRRFPADELDALMRLTEGWPGGLSLALIALADGRVPAQLSGADPYFADYLARRDPERADARRARLPAPVVGARDAVGPGLRHRAGADGLRGGARAPGTDQRAARAARPARRALPPARAAG